jgi:hypothetical protein
MAFQWSVKPTDTFPAAYANYTRAVFTSGRRVAEARAEEMLNFAKTNAPWTDRTGRARAGLNVEVADSPGVIAQVTLSHDPSLPYTLFLEISNQGRFAIIAPTIDKYGAIFMRDMQNMMNLQLVTRGG